MWAVQRLDQARLQGRQLTLGPRFKCLMYHSSSRYQKPILCASAGYLDPKIRSHLHDLPDCDNAETSINHLMGNDPLHVLKTGVIKRVVHEMLKVCSEPFKVCTVGRVAKHVNSRYCQMPCGMQSRQHRSQTVTELSGKCISTAVSNAHV